MRASGKRRLSGQPDLWSWSNSVERAKQISKSCQISYAFNLAHMREAMKQFDGRRFVEISAVNASTPIILTDGVGNTALLLTLPMEAAQTQKAA